MNDPRINEILKDLAALDPVFRDEERTRPLVEHLLALAPQGRIDEAFKSRLRRELIAQAHVVPVRRTGFDLTAALTGNWMRLALERPYAGLVYAGGGALAVLLVMMGFTYGPELFAPRGVSVVSVGERAFGDLIVQGDGGFGASAMKGSSESLPTGQVGVPTLEGDIAVRAVAPTAAFGMGGGGSGIADMPSSLIYPAPDVPRVDFVYRGEIPDFGNAVDVLRRVKPDTSTGGALSALRRFTMGLLDLGEFSGANVESFSLTEDKPFGYAVYVNPMEGTISIGQNWRRWPQTIDGPGVIEGNVAMPPEAELTAIADAFLDEYDIDRGNYGAPIVQKNWGGAMPLGPSSMGEALAEEKMIMPAYVQEIAIIYPYLVNEEFIYDEGGNPTGLYVGVNVKEKRVSNVSGLMTRAYESSPYAAEHNVEVLLDYAERRYWSSEGARTVTVEVGVPELGYMNTWVWSGTGGTEVVVPALVFPVPQNLNIPNMYFPPKLVVPLAKDLIENQGGGVRILQ